MSNGGGENLVSAASTKGGATPVAPAWHTALLVAILLAVGILQGLPQVTSRAEHMPSRISAYLYTLGYELFLLGFVWLAAALRYKVPLREIIGGAWHRWRDFWRDVGIAILFWFAVIGMLLTASHFLHFSGVQAAKELLPQTNLELAVFVVLSTTAGFCEEVVFRGYLQRQFTAWTRNVSVGVVLQAIVFGTAHLYQGVKGVIVISIYGAMFGILAAGRKSLRPGIIQHCAQDSLSGIAFRLAMKYKVLQLIRF